MNTPAQQQSTGSPVQSSSAGATVDDDDSGEIQIEIFDERSEDEHREPPKNEAALSEDPDEDELSSYSDGVRKRIDKLTWQRKEQQRQREEAERQRDEAVNFARNIVQENQRYKQQLQTGAGQLLESSKKAAESEIASARAELAKAHESGDTESLIAAQERLNKAQFNLQSVEQRQQEYSFNTERARQQSQQPAPQQQPQRPAPPSDKAKQWAEENPWFLNDDHRDMTAVAYAEHEKMIRNEGIKPDTDEYYDRLSKVVRRRFPEYFERAGNSTGDDTGSGRQPSSSSTMQPPTVVAPGQRASGVKPRTVRLSSSQVAVAKQLGLTPQQYAEQIAKDLVGQEK